MSFFSSPSLPLLWRICSSPGGISSSMIALQHNIPSSILLSSMTL